MDDLLCKMSGSLHCNLVSTQIYFPLVSIQQEQIILEYNNTIIEIH